GAALRCERGCRVAGRLADARGEALALAPVWLLQNAPEWSATAACERHLLSDRNGMVELRGVLPGDYTLVVTAAHTVAFAEFTVGNPSTTPAMPLPKLRFCATGALEGTLRDAGGRPLPGHRLVVHSSDLFDGMELWWRKAGVDFITEVWTDRDGRFRANGLPPGHWSISGPAQGEADVDAGGAAAAVDLQTR